MPRSPSKALAELRDHLGTVQDLEHAAEVLAWDQETYMPDEGARPRAKQLSTLKRLAHETFTSDRTATLLGNVQHNLEGSESFGHDLYRVTRRDYKRAKCLPSDLVASFSEATSIAQQAWKKARAQDGFGTFAPHLETLVDLSRQKADAYGYEDSPYDALLEEYEPGMTAVALSTIFEPLREQLVPIVETLGQADQPETSFLRKSYDTQDQLDFGLRVARDFGYDLGRGRMDLSEHPFSTSFSITDVRITTRVDANNLSTAFFGTLHEAGHAIYEQGFASELERTPLADGTSLGIHESQSRLWENQIGRSAAFWKHYFPLLRKTFRRQLVNVSRKDFVRGINRVQPSLIRVEADEVTYNLHIMLRYEIERKLIEGSLSVSELPEVWNAKMNDYLGIEPPDDTQGVLQDIHWSLGAFGYFPTYALGTIMSAQIFESAEDSITDLEKQIQAGQFGDLLAWLRLHIHRYGRRRSALTLLRNITGSELSAVPWLTYVREKYGRLYSIDL